jgi:RNA polymerase primary sigma factor
MMVDHDPNDPVVVYMSEIARIAPLAKDEEIQLFRQLEGPGDWDEGRENIARRLIEGHLAQVVSIAKKHSDSGVDMLDLIQEGNKGLLSAIRNFAGSPIGDFSDYAAVCIDDAIKNALG